MENKSKLYYEIIIGIILMSILSLYFISAPSSNYSNNNEYTKEISKSQDINPEDFSVEFNDGLLIKNNYNKEYTESKITFYIKGVGEEKTSLSLVTANIPLQKISNSQYKYNISISGIDKLGTIGEKYLVIEVNSSLIIESDNNIISIGDGENFLININFLDIKGLDYKIDKNKVYLNITNVKDLQIDPTITFTTEQVEALQLTPLSNNTFGIVYCDEVSNDITYMAYYTNGTQITSATDIDTEVGDCNYNQVSATPINSNKIAITYGDPNANYIYTSIYYINGTQNIAPYEISAYYIDNSYFFSSDTINNTNYVIGFTDTSSTTSTASFIICNLAGNCASIINVDSDIGTDSYGVSVSVLDSDEFVIGWYDNVDSDTTFAVYYTNGTARTSATDIDSNIVDAYYNSISALTSNIFVFGWYDGSLNDIVSSVYYTNGTQILAMTTSDSTAGSSPSEMSVSRRTDNTYYIGWYDGGSTDVSYDIIYVNGTVLLDNQKTSYNATGWNSLISSKLGINIGICNSGFVHAWANGTALNLFSTFYSNGTEWDGNCVYLTGVSNTCSYLGTGNWAVTCSDYCNITSNVDGGGTGNNFTAIGVGRFILEANISGFKKYKFAGGCNATCTSSGCIRI